MSELEAQGWSRRSSNRSRRCWTKRGAQKAKSSRRSGRSARSDQGPLKRVHQALRQGRVEEAFRINKDLAASGVKEAAKLEDTGNLGELRELIRMAQSAEAKGLVSDPQIDRREAQAGQRRISRASAHARHEANNLRANRMLPEPHKLRASRTFAEQGATSCRHKLDRNHPKGKERTLQTSLRRHTGRRAKDQKGFSVADVPRSSRRRCVQAAHPPRSQRGEADPARPLEIAGLDQQKTDHHQQQQRSASNSPSSNRS